MIINDIFNITIASYTLYILQDDKNTQRESRLLALTPVGIGFRYYPLRYEGFGYVGGVYERLPGVDVHAEGEPDGRVEAATYRGEGFGEPVAGCGI